MKRAFTLIKKEWFEIIGISFLFLYELIFSSLIGISPFNHIANIVLVLFFISSIVALLLKKEFTKSDNRPFFIFFLLLSFFFLLSDVCNNSLSFKPFVLLIALFSSYSLYKFTNLSLSTFLLAFLLATGLGLSIIVTKNIKSIIEIKSIYSDPFLNLDSFAAIARNGFCIGLLLIFGFKENKFPILLKLLTISFTLLCLLYLVLSFRVGSLILTLLFVLVSLTYLLWIKKKIVTIVILYCLVILGFFAILFIPSKIDVLSRIQLSFFQLFDLDYIYEGSTRERAIMVFRDLSLSLRFPFYGAGSNFSQTVNYITGHNAFGCIALSYGWLSLIIYSILCFVPSFYFLRKKHNNQITYFFLYFLTIQFFDLLYGMGTTSRQNYLITGLAFALYAKDKTAVGNQKIMTCEITI